MVVSDNVLLALIVAVPTLLSPIVALWLNNRGKAAETALAARLRAEEKAADWARQDAVAEKQAQMAAQQIVTAEAAARRGEEVAKQANEAAKLLAIRQDANVARLEEQSVILRTTSAKVDVVHGLVNSQYTAAVQAEMDATVALSAVLEEIVAMKAAQSQPVEQSTKDAIVSTKRHIAELRVTLTERQAQAKTADAATAKIAKGQPVIVADMETRSRLHSIDDLLQQQAKKDEGA